MSLNGLSSAALQLGEDPPVWEDAQEFLIAACDELKPTDLIHHPNFSYFEAMSAVALMEPKMDAGMLREGCESKSVEDLVSEGRAPLALSPSQLQQVAQQLLACEATWHAGHSLAQTVFTCLYLHDPPDRVRKHVVLGALVTGTRACVRIVQSLVCSAGVAEEEDFVGHTFQLPLVEQVEDQEQASEAHPVAVGGEEALGATGLLSESEQSTHALRALRLAEEWMQARKDSIRPENEAPKMEDDGGDPNQYLENLLTMQDCDVLLAHLRFRLAFLRACICFGKHTKSLTDAARDLDTAKQQLARVRELISSCSASPPIADVPSETDVLGFDTWVNQRLLAPTPPRRIALCTWEATVGYFEGLVLNMQKVIDVTKCTNLQDILTALQEFGRQSPQPSIVVRSWMCEMLLQGDSLLGRAPWPAVIREALWLPPDAMADAPEVEAFLEDSKQVTQMLIRSLCASPGRVRRKLRHLIDHWGGLHQAAEEVDDLPAVLAYLQSRGEAWVCSWWGTRVFTSWVQNQLCRMQILQLSEGFPLGLYSEREYLMVYWYLEYVQTSLIENIHQADKSLRDGFAADAAAAAASASKVDSRLEGTESDVRPSSSRKGKKKKKGGRGESNSSNHSNKDIARLDTPLTPVQTQLLIEACRLEAQRSMCRGLVRMLAGLISQGLIKVPGGTTGSDDDVEDSTRTCLPRYNSLAQIFEQRFAMMHASPFPPALHFADYVGSMDTSTYNPTALYEYSSDCFASARHQAANVISIGGITDELKREMTALIHAAQTNQVALMVVCNASSPNDLQVSLEFYIHRVFAVVKAKSKAKSNP